MSVRVNKIGNNKSNIFRRKNSFSGKPDGGGALCGDIPLPGARQRGDGGQREVLPAGGRRGGGGLHPETGGGGVRPQGQRRGGAPHLHRVRVCIQQRRRGEAAKGEGSERGRVHCQGMNSTMNKNFPFMCVPVISLFCFSISLSNKS